jgi:predicted membrane protein
MDRRRIVGIGLGPWQGLATAGIGAAIVMVGGLIAQFATPAESRPTILEEP